MDTSVPSGSPIEGHDPMADVPWWYSVIHEWRQRAFLETHHWPPDIAITMSVGTVSTNSAAPAPALTYAQ